MLSVANLHAQGHDGITKFYLKGLYSRSGFVYSLVNRIANKIASQPIEVHRITYEKGRRISKPVHHDAISALQQPNPLQSYYHFMNHIVSELVLMGNSAILVPSERLLIPYAWENIAPVNSEEGIKYQVSGAGFGFSSTCVFNAKSMLHTRLANVVCMYEGMSPFEPGKDDLEFLKLSRDFLSSAYKSGASPDLVISSDPGTDYQEGQLQNFMDKLLQSHFGRLNQRKPLVLPRGMQAKRMEQHLVDAEQKYHSRDARLNLMALFNMPPHEMGMQEAGSLGSEDAKNATKNFWESTLIPIQKLVAETFSGFFFGAGNQYHCVFNNENVECLQADQLRKAEIASKMAPFFTINEIRERVWQASEMPSGLGSRPVIRGNDGPEEPEKRKLVKAAASPNRTAIKAGWVKGRLELERRLTAAGEKNLRPKIESWLAEQMLTVINVVFRFAAKRNKSALDDLSALMAELEGEIDETLESAWIEPIHRDETFWKISETAYDIFLKSPLIPNDPAIERIRARSKKGRRKVLEARKLESFAGISETTTNLIVDDIADGMKGSETLEQVAKRVERYHLDELIPKRSETIARTEVLGAVSYGQSAANDDIEKAMPDQEWENIWLTGEDGRVRASHQKLNGARVPKGEKFSNGLKYPRDPAGKASEIILCRCSWIMVPKGENV